MFEKVQIDRSTVMVPVRIQFHDGATLFGDVSCTSRESLSALILSQWEFLPVETDHGVVHMIAKSAMASIRLDHTLADADDPTISPYAVLGVDPNASEKELRQARRQRLAACHPDQLASLAMDPAFTQLAHRLCQQINHAFDLVDQRR